ncbi:DUF411 domain-containing protein [Cyanobacterium sp. Dongsha4]|uniref:DUF411 domain-containing protein n=1 Tax=Cyanobacterium sp. DS4 TaxID=2878255 RepID=UPI002E81D95C|nr:DUF411 domain-containing protein [Cyanobacterium sp. Dongsha4]WVK99758.1 DUF411 domain-containing protein [Cyanobacterium sp. Dongsha4]
MLKFSTKIILASSLLSMFSLLLGGLFYVTPLNIANADEVVNNSIIKSVWDRETKPSYSGVRKMTVYRSPNCGCCGGWIEHARKHGFIVKDIKTNDLESIKQKYKIPTELTSCHTAIIDGYAMEGHIPADDIKSFLSTKSQFSGLAVPAMPIGTPGMEAQNIKQPFQVLAFNKKGEVQVFKNYHSY